MESMIALMILLTMAIKEVASFTQVHAMLPQLNKNIFVIQTHTLEFLLVQHLS